MNRSLALIAAVLERKDEGYLEALQSGVNSSILNPEGAHYWEILTGHYEQFNQVPSIDYFKGLAPGYEHEDVRDSVESIVFDLKTVALGTDIDGLLQEVAEVNVADPWEAKKRLVGQADVINVRNQQGGTDLVIGSDRKSMIRTLKRLQKGEGLIGFPWPWAYLNRLTPGLCPGNVFYFYGRQKSFKTWLLLYIANFYESEGLKTLVFTREMTKEELSLRAAALICGFEWTDFLKGDIPTVGMEMLDKTLADIEKRQKLIVTEKADGLAGFKAKIEEIRPQVVIHDYFKAIADDEMGDQFRAQEHTYVAKTIDGICNYAKKKAKIPFLLCGHANREGDKTRGKSTTEHAWSDQITRRVDGAFRIIPDKINKRVGVIVNAGRNMSEDIAFTLDGQLCAGFGEFLEEGADWVADIERADNAQGGAHSKHGGPRPDPNSKFTHQTWKKSKDRRRR